MPGEFYFMALGGLGVSLAGFAGLIAALDKRPAASPIKSWRIRVIVSSSFVVTFAGFGTVAAYSATGEDLALTIRIASVFLVAANLAGILLGEARPGPAWPNERNRRAAVGAAIARVAALLVNALVGSLGFLQVMFLFQLLFPVSIFFNTVRDVVAGVAEPVAGEPEGAIERRR